MPPRKRPKLADKARRRAAEEEREGGDEKERSGGEKRGDKKKAERRRGRRESLVARMQSEEEERKAQQRAARQGALLSMGEDTRTVDSMLMQLDRVEKEKARVEEALSANVGRILRKGAQPKHMAGRHNILAREVDQMKSVLEHPAFRANPAATIAEHLSNVVKVSQQEREQLIKGGGAVAAGSGRGAKRRRRKQARKRTHQDSKEEEGPGERPMDTDR